MDTQFKILIPMKKFTSSIKCAQIVFIFMLCSLSACLVKEDKETEDENVKLEQTVREPIEEPKIEEIPIEDSASLTDKDFGNRTLEEDVANQKFKEDKSKSTQKQNKITKEETVAPIKLKKKYDKVFALHHNRAVVQLGNKFGYIDGEGHEVVAPKYDFAEDFSGDFTMARVRTKDKVGYVDVSGKEVVPLKYRYVEKFSNGLAHARLIDGEQFYIDRKGNHVCDILDKHYEGIARVKLGKKIGYVDLQGNVIVPIKYDFGTNFQNGMADVKLNEQHFFINNKGECVKDCPTNN